MAAETVDLSSLGERLDNLNETLETLAQSMNHMRFDSAFRGGTSGNTPFGDFVSTMGKKKKPTWDELDEDEKEYRELEYEAKREQAEREYEQLKGFIEEEKKLLEEEKNLQEQILQAKKENNEKLAENLKNELKRKKEERLTEERLSKKKKVQKAENFLNKSAKQAYNEKIKGTEEFYNAKVKVRKADGTTVEELAHPELHERFGSFEEYDEHNKYMERKSKRYEESRHASEGPFGNTFIGKQQQKGLHFQQRADDISQMMKTFGKGSKNLGAKYGGKLGKTLDKLGGSLDKAAGSVQKFGGGILQVVEGLWDMFKAFVNFENRLAETEAKLAEFNMQENKLRYERDKQLNLLEGERIANDFNYETDIAIKNFEMESSLALKKLQIMSEQQVKSTQITLGSFQDGINQTAYNAAESRLDFMQKTGELDIESKYAHEKFQNEKILRQRQYEYEKMENIAAVNQAETDYEAQSTENAFEKKDYAAKNSAALVANHVKETTVAGTEIGAGIGTLAAGNTLIGAGAGAVGGAITGVATAGKYMDVNNVIGAGDKYTKNQTNAFNNNEPYENNIDKAVAYEVSSGVGRMLIGSESTSIRNRAQLKSDLQQLSQDADAIASTIKAASNLELGALQKQTESINSSFDKLQEVEKATLNVDIETKKAWLKATQTFEKAYSDFSKTTRNLAVNMGYTTKEQADAYRNTVYETMVIPAAKFGRTEEDAMKFQENFAETTGRNRSFDKTDFEKTFSMAMLVGDDLTQSFESAMEIFNTGVSSSLDMLYESVNEVNKLGLNSKKYTKTLVDSLKMAQKYNFKGGTENVMKMAKWAENTRFNMNSLSGMLDKVSEGGLEGVIKMGAEFQVLGGHAAMNADPLAMMYERYADPESYAKRMQDMTKGFGRLDSKTGETTFSGPEYMMMEQLAKVQGRSFEDVANEVRQRNKKEVVSKQLRGDFNDDQQSFVTNNAKFNKETGKFEVSFMQGNEVVTRNVDELNEDMLKNVIPVEHNQKMEWLTERLVTATEAMAGEENRQRKQVVNDNFSVYDVEFWKRLQISTETFNREYDTIITKTSEMSEFITDSYKEYTNKFKESQQDTAKAAEEMTNLVNSLKQPFEDFSDIINAFVDKNLNIAQDLLNKKEERNSKDTISKKNYENAKAMVDWFADESNEGNINDTVVKLLAKFKTGSTNLDDYKDALSEGYDDLLDAFENVGLGDDNMDSFKNLGTKDGMETIKGIIKYMSENADAIGLNERNKATIIDAAKNIEVGNVSKQPQKSELPRYDWGGATQQFPNSITPFTTQAKDAITSGNGQPMNVAASSVIPVHDGTAKIARTDPKDTAIFAKTGGPFDKLFDGIFGKVNSIYEGLKERELNRQRNIKEEFDRWKDPKAATKHYMSNVYNTITAPQRKAYENVMSLKENAKDFGGKIKTFFGIPSTQNSNVVARDYDGTVGSSSTNVTNVKEGSETVNNFTTNSTPYAPVGGMNPSNVGATNGGFSGETTLKMDTVKVEINGRLDISSGNQSVNVISELRRDPHLMRELTQMIAREVSKSINGGRNTGDFNLGRGIL